MLFEKKLPLSDSRLWRIQNARRLSSWAYTTTSLASDTSIPLSSSTTVTDKTTNKSNSSELLDVFVDTQYDMQQLESLASQRPTPLRLADMYEYGRGIDPAQRLRNSQFLHRELPIRVAQRAYDLLTLPHGLSNATPIRQVAATYIQYLQQFKSRPCPQNKTQEEEFTDFVQSLVLDRAAVPISIFRGILAWMGSAPHSDDDHQDQISSLSSFEEQPDRLQEMEDALYRFFTARVGLRFLTVHHVLSSRRPSAKALKDVTFLFPPDQSDDFLGCIQTNCDLVKEVNKVAKLIHEQTMEYYGICPEIEVVDCIEDTDQAKDGNSKNKTRDFTYVPHHLHYMICELLKNSCRATVQQFRAQEMHTQGPNGHDSAKIPSIKVVMVKGEEDVTIKVADKGGGIPRSKMERIWKFAHSTADQNEAESDFGTDATSGARIRGFGLPLARIYARYFGGELTLKSTEGYGLDAYLHLPRLGDACEKLPHLVKSSPGELDSMPNRYVKN
jgi:pyruvate dehydrogenase kinase 2/3/4